MTCYSNVMQYLDFPGKRWRKHRGIKPSTNARDRAVHETLPACMVQLAMCATGGPGLSVRMIRWTTYHTSNYDERWTYMFTRTAFVSSQRF